MATNIGPKIGIDGEAEYRKQLQNIIQQTKTLDSQMKALESSYKKNGTSLKENAERHKLLKEKQALLKEECAKLADAVEQSAKKYGEADTKTQKWKESLNRCQQALNEVNDELRNTSFAESWKRKCEEVGESLEKVGKKISDVGKNLSAKVTAPIMAVGVASVKTAADFETSMNNVSAISGATGDDLEALSEKAKEMGSKTKFSASESADAMSYMAMAGWKTQDMLDGLEGIMNLAAASGSDLATTSDILTDGLTAFGLTSADSAHMADVMAVASSNANTNVELLGESYKYCASTAGAMGYSVEDITESLGLMANAGVKGSQAGTSLKNAMINLAKPTKAMKVAMDKYGISITDTDGNMKSWDEVVQNLRDSLGGLNEAEQTATAATLFGKEATAGMLSVINAAPEDINKLSIAIDNADGTASSMAETMEQGLNGQITKLKSATEAASISIGERLSPYIEKLVAKVQEAADWFNSLSDAQLDTIITIAGVVAAVGPALIVIGTLCSSVGKIVSFVGGIPAAWAAASGAFTAAAGAIGVSTAALGGIIAAVVAVIAIGVLLYKNWDKIKEMAAKFGAYMSERWTAFKEDTAKKWGEMKEKAAAKFEELKTKASATVENLKSSVKQKWEDMKSNAVTTIENMKSSVKQKFEDIKSSITEKIDGAKKNVKDAIDKIKGFFNFSFKWPKLTLPHFKATGGEFPWGMLGQGKAPKISVEWYKKGYSQAIGFSKPTIVGNKGFGDGNGTEWVVGESHLYKMIQGAMSSGTTNNWGGTTINVYGAPGQDINALADIIEDRLVMNVQRRANAW